MTRFGCLLITLFSLCCISPALAQNGGTAATPPPAPAVTITVAPTTVPASTTSDPDAPFQNWETMKNYLDSQGIDSNAVNWSAIDPSCEGTKMDSGDVAYNKCLYQKARDSSLFATQRAQCQTLATARWPDSMIQKQADIRDKGKDAAPLLTAADLQSKRDASLLKCMMDLGWASADNWLLGRSVPITPIAPAPLPSP